MTVHSLRSQRALTITAMCALPLLSPVLCAQGKGSTPQKPGSVLDRPLGQPANRLPENFADGADLPNGWRITPAGSEAGTFGDLILNLKTSPDGRIVVGVHAGFLPHGVEVFDVASRKLVQHIELPSAWQGMEWAPGGDTLFIAGGNASGRKNKDNPVAPIYEFTYTNGRLSEKPATTLVETIRPKDVWWSGVSYSAKNHTLYASNRGTGIEAGNVVVFDMKTRKILTRIPVETTPYQTLLSADGKRLFVSNWSSHSVSVIDTSTNTVIKTVQVGLNPNDMKISADGRLFVACSNDNSVYAIDARTLDVIERISTTLTPKAPEGSTPNALVIDDKQKLLFVANADNNSVAVVHIEDKAHSSVVGFIPTGWYPSALALADRGRTLFVGNSKGYGAYADPKGPHSPFASQPLGDGTVKTLQASSLEVVPVRDLRQQLPRWTKQVNENTPYRDSLLSEARMPQEPSVIPSHVGAGSPIKHIIYVIKENRTYDQEFGDLPNANGDPSLTIFGEKVTPNQHALARKYVILDNLYCDAEVSVDGHSWSNSAYATDFNEKQWPPLYGGHSVASYNVRAMVPSGGHLWDLAKRKGLTFRSYGENASRSSTGTTMDAAPGAEGLRGHVSREYLNGLGMRDTQRMAVFIREFNEYEKAYESKDPEKRLPNYIVMSLPEDHTMGGRSGGYAPLSMVANNDFAIGQLVDRVSHSKYWPETAIFIIEDDAQDGADHVDARRTVGLVISPYVKRGIVDSTLYSTSSMIRTMELLLGLPPMSQYDAAAMPIYASFGTEAKPDPFNVIQPLTDVNVKNTKGSVGADESSKMDFSDIDRAPMHALNEIIWKSVKGKDSTMPAPVHRFRPILDAGKAKDDDD